MTAFGARLGWSRQGIRPRRGRLPIDRHLIKETDHLGRWMGPQRGLDGGAFGEVGRIRTMHMILTAFPVDAQVTKGASNGRRRAVTQPRAVPSDRGDRPTGLAFSEVSW